jgi:dUTP pyrophosphatase
VIGWLVGELLDNAPRPASDQGMTDSDYPNGQPRLDITDRPQVRVIRLESNPDLDLPAYFTPGAAGADVRACLPEGPVTLNPGDRFAVPTGLVLHIPAGFEVQVRARSGLALSHGIGLPNGLGTIDSDYRGELKILLINWGKEPFKIHHGDRIAQLVLAPVVQAKWEESDGQDLEQTARNWGGFGHTGTK